MTAKHLHTQAMQTTRNAEIDFLRAYAVLLVVGRHFAALAYDHIIGKPPEFQNIVNLAAGVDIFFVISGYVISGAFDRLRGQGLAGASLYFTFLARRLVRLWPASTFWLLYCLLASVIFMGTGLWPSPIESARAMLAGIAYIYNFEQIGNWTVTGYFWSLSVEWQFYLIFPFLAMKLERETRIWFLCLAIAACMLWRPGGTDWWMFRFDGLLFGMLVYETRSNHHAATGVRVLRDFLSGRRLIAACLTVVLLMEAVYVGKYIQVQSVATTFTCVFAFALVYIAARGEGITVALLGGPITRWVGLRSYSMYLSHIPIALTVLGIFRWQQYQLNVNSFILFSLIGTIIASEISYRLLEIAPQKKASKALRGKIDLANPSRSAGP